jgi:hypothetical protein
MEAIMAESNCNTAAPVLRHYTNVEILSLIQVALTYGCKEGNSDPIIIESWRALDTAFESGRKRGYEQGFNAGQAAAMEAADQAACAANTVIVGVFRRINGRQT